MGDSPAQLYNEDKYDQLQVLAQLPRNRMRRDGTPEGYSARSHTSVMDDEDAVFDDAMDILK
jgi:hypothetical protein